MEICWRRWGIGIRTGHECDLTKNVDWSGDNDSVSLHNWKRSFTSGVITFHLDFVVVRVT